MDKPIKSQSLLLSILQPGLIALLTVMFFSGVGLARFLGSDVNWGRSLLFCFAFYFLVWSRNLLSAFFDHPASSSSVLQPKHPRFEQLAAQTRNTYLTYAMLALTGSVGFTLFALIRNPYAFPLALLMGVAVLSFFFSTVPPLRLQHRGYGEIIESIVVANIAPATGLVMNYGEIHSVIAMLTLPVTLLYLPALLVFSLPNYLADKKGGNPNLVNKLDWERSMKLHNVLVGSAFLAVGVFSLTGLNWDFSWPMFLALPLGIFQIVQILGIMNGAKPRWQILKWTAAASVGLMAYLVLLTLWLH